MAYLFDGLDDCLTQALAGVSVPITMGTLAAVDNVTGTRGLFTWRTAGNSSKQYVRHNNANAQSASSIASGSQALAAAGDSFVAGAWGGVAGKFTSAVSRQAFRNAVGGALNTGSRPVPDLTGVVMGAATDATGTGVVADFFNGRLAECAIWSALLSDAEIVSLHRGFSPRRVRPQSLLAYWPLVRELINLKGGAAALTSAPTVAAHPRVYA